MPIQRELDKVQRLLRTTLSGCVTKQEVRDHLAALRRNGAHQCPELIDARTVEEKCFSRQDLMTFAHHSRDWLGQHAPARRAVVVNSEELFGTARVVASLVAGWIRVGVFVDVAEAEAWLSGTGPIPIPVSAPADSAGAESSVPA
jgi:hypothetical protein